MCTEFCVLVFVTTGFCRYSVLSVLGFVYWVLSLLSFVGTEFCRYWVLCTGFCVLSFVYSFVFWVLCTEFCVLSFVGTGFCRYWVLCSEFCVLSFVGTGFKFCVVSFVYCTCGQP